MTVWMAMSSVIARWRWLLMHIRIIKLTVFVVRFEWWKAASLAIKMMMICRKMMMMIVDIVVS